MAAPGSPKLTGCVECMSQMALAKDFFPYVNIHQEQVGVPQIHLLGHWDTITTPYLAGRSYCHGHWTSPKWTGPGQCTTSVSSLFTPLWGMSQVL